jgi:CSLREA domain-containing protein
MRPVTFLIAALFVLGVAPLTAQTTFTVTSNNDIDDGTCSVGPGHCSLREAINAANASAATTDTIAFGISGAGPHTIAPGSALPTITDPLVIDGYTQSGASANTNPIGQAINATLMIVLDGSSAGAVSGLTVTAAGCTVRGLVINQFGGHGIHISGAGATANLVEGNFIGTDANGTSDLGNTDDGVFIESGPTNTVGGTTAASRNLVSGNGLKGIDISNATAFDNVVQGNYIGTDVNGTAAIANDEHGISIDGAPNNTVGGTAAEAGNMISGNTIHGVEIVNAGATGNLVQGNLIGTDASGTAALANGTDGVRIAGAPSNTIGGATAAARNVISGNGAQGVNIGSSGNLVQGNFIGTDVTGTADLGNSQDGVRIDDVSGNTVGGIASAPGAPPGNVISGNDRFGVFLLNGTSGTQVQGNLIGTDVSGTTALGNGSHGVAIPAAPGNTIGGTTAGTRNVISGNAGLGISISQSSTGNVVQGNYIGTQADGISPLGNGFHGVQLTTNASNNTIGGTGVTPGQCDGPCNTIAFNGTPGVAYDGVRLSSGTGNAVQGNAIFSNEALGIDVDVDGVTANDPGDADTGPNNVQNFPVLSAAFKGSTLIEGTLNSTASTVFTIELFSSGSCDASGYGEGEVFLGSTGATTDGSGDASFTASFPTTLPTGTSISATATDPSGNTSEFSLCATVADFTVALTSDSAAGPRGGSTDYTVTLDPDGGTFAGDVALSCSGLPAQTVCAFVPSIVSPGASGTTSTLTVTTTDPGTPVGTASFMVDGTSGSVQHSAGAKLTVGDYQVSVLPATVVAVQGSDASYAATVTPLGGTFDEPVTLSCDNEPAGAVCSFSVNPVTPGASPATSTLTVSTTAGTTPTGSTDLDVVGSSGALGDTTTATLQVTDFAMAATPSSVTVTRGAPATYTVTVTPQDGPVDDAVTLSCTGLPAQATCAFSPSSVTPGGTSADATVTVSTATGTPTGSDDFTIVGTAGSLQGGATATLVVTDFMVAVSPSSRTVTGGQSATYTVTVDPDGGSFGESVSLVCSGLPTGGSCDFTPNAVTPGATAATSTMTVSTVAATLPPIVPRWDGWPRASAVLALLCVALFGFGLALVRRVPRARRPGWVLAGGGALAFALFLGACGGGEPTGPSSQTHTITVTGTAGSLEHSATTTLTVQ